MFEEITFAQVKKAHENLLKFITRTPVRTYSDLNEYLGNGIQAFIKHENHLPTNAFKLRNALSAIAVLNPEELSRGVIAATRGNHGLGVAYAANLLGAKATICVPFKNNCDKNAGIKALGARLIEGGEDFDECGKYMENLAVKEKLTPIYASSNSWVICGAATITLEFLESVPDLDALVVAVGGGSQAAGAVLVAKQLKPTLKIYAVQAENACAMHDAWHSGEPKTHDKAETFADGLATRCTYPMTFSILKNSLANFIKVSDQEIAAAIRVILEKTHNLVEGAGAAGFAGLTKLRQELKGLKVGAILSGANIDKETLKDVLNHKI